MSVRQIAPKLFAGYVKKTTITAMDLHAIVQDIDAEIDRLRRLRALLAGHPVPLKGR